MIRCRLSKLERELRRENVRLRAELSRSNRRYDELLEKVLFERKPARLFKRSGEPSEMVEIRDAWSAAMEDAVRNAEGSAES